jgi:nucleotide-binding universal stress UspA family protein
MRRARTADLQTKSVKEANCRCGYSRAVVKYPAAVVAVVLLARIHQGACGLPCIQPETTVPTVARILCPVDFSDFSRRTLDYAVTLARWYGASVTALHVRPPVVPTSAALAPYAPVEPVPLTPGDLEAVRRQIAALIPAAAHAQLVIDPQAVEGDPAHEILAEAAAADLIVMGTHGRSGFERLVLGSVAETVLRKAPCSLLTIPFAAVQAAETVPVLFRRIVAAVDFSEVSMRALNEAAGLAAEADAHLTALHVIEVPEHLALWIDRVDGIGHVRAWAEAAARHMRAAIGPQTREYARVDQRVETGKAYREILRVADEQRADLIVIGAHGHGVIERLFVGSTAQHVVRRAPCPVLVVRQRSNGGHG